MLYAIEGEGGEATYVALMLAAIVGEDEQAKKVSGETGEGTVRRYERDQGLSI